MTDKDDKKRLDALEARLSKARKEKQDKAPKEKRAQDNRSMVRAYKIAIELAVAMFVGLAAGWFLDQWLGTTPWLMLIFFLLGVAAGFRNVYKAAQMMGHQPPGDETNKKF